MSIGCGACVDWSLLPLVGFMSVKAREPETGVRWHSADESSRATFLIGMNIFPLVMVLCEPSWSPICLSKDSVSSRVILLTRLMNSFAQPSCCAPAMVVLCELTVAQAVDECVRFEFRSGLRGLESVDNQRMCLVRGRVWPIEASVREFSWRKRTDLA